MNRLRFKNQSLDSTDETLITVLAKNARISTAELARTVGLSAPSVAERIRRLEDVGVIRGYTVDIDPAALGFAITAWLRVRPLPGQLKKVAEMLANTPDFVECDRITGDDCFIAKAHVRSMQDLEVLIDRLLVYATTNTSVVQSSPFEARLPPLRAI
ncbi:Lrp/AsnC family transcriptional regulator [Rhodospirillaceae bacterium KN72]|uniref:Lrp/AsnC family transcriptional regulator n=1 Tax=Pacificispira spongiicola TaxID=2729598 RepID=A0A7Y0HCV8_9PROT|nr:Lrp/AsnC family transcriptional regulator [Pacificispira spongiicola]NMM43010.1 Lrp/AsnC family transcriptional regulator [Pacificispira spongiicola]